MHFIVMNANLLKTNKQTKQRPKKPTDLHAPSVWSNHCVNSSFVRFLKSERVLKDRMAVVQCVRYDGHIAGTGLPRLLARVPRA